MIYIIANTAVEASRFAVEAHLARQRVQIITDGTLLEGKRFEEEDEVYVLKGASRELQYVTRVSNDKSYPKPFYRTEMEVPHVREEARL